MRCQLELQDRAHPPRGGADASLDGLVLGFAFLSPTGGGAAGLHDLLVEDEADEEEESGDKDDVHKRGIGHFLGVLERRLSARQQEAAAEGATTGGGNGHFGVAGYLALAALAA